MANQGVTVSEIEMQNIRRIFQQFDEDGSETIDIDELNAVMQSLGVLMDEEHLLELVEQVASEGKTELTLDEFVSLITLWKEASQYKLFDGKGFKSLAQQHVEKALSTRSFISDASWRSLWDFLVCLGAMACWGMVLGIDIKGHDFYNTFALIIGDILITLLFGCDTILSARTCFVQDVRLTDDPWKCFVYYAKTWLVPDVLATVPLDMIFTLAGVPVAATVLRHLRLLKVAKIPFLWQSSGTVPITSSYIQLHFHVLPLFQLFVTLFLMVHGFAIGWALLKQRAGSDDPLLNEQREYPYITAVYFVLYTLSTVGLGDVAIRGPEEQWYASMVLVGSMATNGIVIGKLVAIVQRADINKERRAKLRETLAVLDHFSIPRQLQEEILQFQAHVFEHNLGAAYEGIVSGLPNEMRTNISLFVKMKLVRNVPLFEETHYMIRIAVAQNLGGTVARPEQYIVVHGQRSGGLHFIAYGFADMFAVDGSYDGTLRSGDFFGDQSLLGESAQTNSVKAITYCDLWVLSVHRFNLILERFPKFRRFIESERDKMPKESTEDVKQAISPPPTQLMPPPALMRANTVMAPHGLGGGGRASQLRAMIQQVRSTRLKLEAIINAQKA